MDALRELLDRLWEDYKAITPEAAAIHGLLAGEAEVVVNDHIALRTWGDPRVGIAALSRPFVDAGYREAGRYRFAAKRLVASHFAHEDESLPLVFISELVLGECSRGLRDMVAKLLAEVPEAVLAAPDVTTGSRPDVTTGSRPELAALGRPWAVSFAEVEELRRESEYAAWLAAFGWRANHFTVSVGALRRFGELARLNEFLKGHGFAISQAGGEIKGSRAQGLEQSSTQASAVEVGFSDGVHVVPGCYYEFARRYPGPDGRLFRGFIEGSADRIFESTDALREGARS